MSQERVQILMLAVSRAGHDKGKTYAVIRAEQDLLWLVNGKERTLEKPKQKKRIHVQPVTHLERHFSREELTVTGDEGIKALLKRYASRLASQTKQP